MGCHHIVNIYNPMTFCMNVLKFVKKLSHYENANSNNCNYKKLMVIGGSGAGPYLWAFAIAYNNAIAKQKQLENVKETEEENKNSFKLPKLEGIISIAGCGPLTSFKEGLDGADNSMKLLYGKLMPSVIAMYITYFFFGMKNMTGDKMIDSFENDIDKNAMIQHPEARERLVSSVREAFNNGVAGPTRDMIISKDYSKWGFKIQQLCELEEIKNVPIYNFFGDKDSMVPISHMRWFENELKLSKNYANIDNIHIIRQNGKSHVSIFFDNDELMEVLTGILK